MNPATAERSRPPQPIRIKLRTGIRALGPTFSPAVPGEVNQDNWLPIEGGGESMRRRG